MGATNTSPTRCFIIPLLVVGAISCGSKQEPPAAPPAATSSPAHTAKPPTAAATVLATGAVKPQVGAEVRVGARISGRVERLLANIGDRVRKGQVIAELEKKDLEAVCRQREAEGQGSRAKLTYLQKVRPKELEKARSEVSAKKAASLLAKQELERARKLVKQDFASTLEQDQAYTAWVTAHSQASIAQKSLEVAEAALHEDIKQAEAEVARTQAVLDYAHTQLAYASITAPIDGVIGSVSTQEGETVAAGLNSPTFVTIVDLQRLQVDAFVDEVDIGKVRTGMKAAFTVDAFPGREFSGEVTAIYPKAVLQDNVVNYDVVVRIAEPYEGLLRPEMTASVTLKLQEKTHD